MTTVDVYALVSRQARAWEAGDVDRILADFAPDGVLVSPGGRWQGHAAIRAAATSFLQGVSSVQVTVTRAFMAGNQGAAEWTWSETRVDGAVHTAEDGIIFQLEDDRIVYWREYFDTAAF